MLREQISLGPQPALCPTPRAVHDTVPGPAAPGGHREGGDGGTVSHLPALQGPPSLGDTEGRRGEDPALGVSSGVRLASVNQQVTCPLGLWWSPRAGQGCPRCALTPSALTFFTGTHAQ